MLIDGFCRVTLVDAFPFCPKISGDDADQHMVLCHSVNIGGVVWTLRYGGGHTTPTCCNKIRPYAQKSPCEIFNSPFCFLKYQKSDFHFPHQNQLNLS